MCISMKSIYIYALIVTCLIVKGYSETIQCYDCDDCHELDDDMLELCPSNETSSEEESSWETSSSSDVSTKKSIMTKRSTSDTKSYQCYSIVKVDGTNREIKKGCVEVPENKKGCEVLKEDEGVSEENCRVCSKTRCNSGFGLNYSIVTVFMVSVLKAFV